MNTSVNLQKISEALNVPVETFFKDKPKDRIPGYISFEELEHFCQQNIEAIKAGNEGQKQANLEYDQKHGEPTEHIKMIRMQDDSWSRGKQHSWMELSRSIKLWKKVEEKK